MVPEYRSPAIRELFYRHYRIFYIVAPDAVYVTLASVQSSRLPLQPID
jgi:toxin ParE1/3/4